MYNYFKIHPLVKEEKSFKGFSIFRSGCHLVQRSKRVWAILVEGLPSIRYNYFKIHPLIKAEKSLKGFSIFSFGGHFVKQSRPV